ncbi:MAG: tRNA (adenosine(37)-N6)-threonylcarbamoyltransferase complex transferase subunit TsaD [Clostridia bacterium]|nr:tRNA (adenosine(37)-N6)-threonylcarbamoyltransferase complex transferase subunit TsaD [Clostridia bacterium]
MENLILAIESSCDETSAAVVKNGREVLSNVISSQIDIHKKFGGVVPEVASRNHILNISSVVRDAMETANVGYSDLSAVAVTYGPGLVGALLVGVSYAKGIATAHNLPLVAVNHIHGHIAANYITHKDLEPPFVCLVASGGHSHILYVRDYMDFEILGRTHDDAAGEAFDKIARVIGLGYPGGPKVEALAKSGNPAAMKFPRVEFSESPYDFSFSGVKTSVINYLHNAEQKGLEVVPADIAASFQTAVTDVLVEHTVRAAIDKKVEKVALAGGVSANGALRQAFLNACQQNDLELFYPEPVLCTDNAAMIGCAGYYKFLKGEFAKSDLNAVANLKL